MKKTTKIFFAILFCIFMLLLSNGKVSAYNSDSMEYDQNYHYGEIIAQDGQTYYYNDWKKAVSEAQNGDTVKFVAYNSNITSSAPIVIENKNITINWNKKNITAKFIVKGGTVNFESVPNQINEVPLITVSDNGTAVIDGNKMDSGNYWNSKSSALIQVGTETSTGTLIIKDASNDNGNGNVCLRGKNVAEVLGPKSNVEITNSKLLSSYGTIIIKGTDNEINVKDSYFTEAGWGGVIVCDKDSKGTKINVSNTQISNANPIELNGQNITLSMNNLTVNTKTEWGLGVFGSNNTVTIKDSSIAGGVGGILTNSSTSNITIDNSEIKGFGYKADGASPGIYAQNIGKIEIKNNSKIEGLIGIYAEGGNIIINDGNVTATNESQDKNIIYALNGKTVLKELTKEYGASIIADNSNADASKAEVTINGGTFNATTEEALVSINDDTTAFSVNSGTFNKPFNKDFVVPEKLELRVVKGDDQKWYVGIDAQNIYNEVKDNTEYSVEIIQGEIEKEATDNSGNNEIQDTNTDGGQLENIINDNNNEENPATGDQIIIFIVLLGISAFGIGGTIYAKRKMNNK